MIETPTTWIPPDSGTVTTDNTGIQRILQDGTVRVEQNSVVRVLQENVVTGKIPITWTEDDS